MSFADLLPTRAPPVGDTAAAWLRRASGAGLALATGLGVVVAAPVAAAPPEGVLAALPAQEVAPLVDVQWLGEVRARTEVLGGVRVNREDASRASYLDLRHGSADASSLPIDGMLRAADLRARLQPRLRIGDWGEVHSQVEAWGLAGGDPHMASLGERFLQTEAQSAGFRAGWGVRRLWLQARLFGLLQFEVGRTPDHFGMGMLRNHGDGLLQDVQSTVDRVRLQAEVFGLKLSISRSNLASWPVASEGGALSQYNQAQSGGRLPTAPLSSGANPLPLQDSADVTRYDLEVQGGRHRDGRGLVWSGALLWQSQDQAFRLESIRDPSPGAQTPQQQAADPDCGDDCILLVQRTLRTYTAQGAIDWRTDWLGSPLRVEAELVGRYGTIGRTDVTATVDAKTIIAGAAAARVTWQRDAMDLQLDGGVASGEGEGGFGVNDTTTFRTTAGGDGQPRSLLTGLRTHRSFRIDGLLFRDVIGAVTNATWLKPLLRWHLGGGVREAPAAGTVSAHGWAIEAAVVAANAVAKGSTPGGQGWLGWEPELAVHYRWQRHLDVWGRGSLLVPGGAFANRAGVEADPAWRGELVLRWQF